MYAAVETDIDVLLRSALNEWEVTGVCARGNTCGAAIIESALKMWDYGGMQRTLAVDYCET